MTQDKTPLEIYGIQLENEEPGFYSRIPAVIYHATYVAKQTKKGHQFYGELMRRKLSPIAIALYGVIKQFAGSQGACWSSRSTLAEWVGCSTGAISEAKKELSEPIEQLNGKPFITVTKKTKRHKTGATRYDHITVTNIWPENNAFMSVKKWNVPQGLGIIDTISPDAMSPDDSQTPSMSPDDTASPGTMSRGDTNNRPSNKRQSVYEPDTAAAAAEDCSKTLRESVSCDALKNTETLHEQLQEQKVTIRTNLKNFGCDDSFIAEVLRKFVPQQIIDGCLYTQQMMMKGKVSSKFGYLRDAIEKGRKWQFTKS